MIKKTASIILALLSFISLAAPVYADPTDTAEVEPYGGHIRLITDVSGFPLDIAVYDSKSEQYSNKTVSGSDYIPISSSDYVQFICEPKEGSSDLSGGEYYIYFYDQDKNVIWDVFDYTDPDTGERNRISTIDLKELNGFQFSNVPDGSFIRVAKANNRSCHLLIWDGCKTSYPLSALPSVFSKAGKFEMLPADGSACVLVPKTAVYLIAKPGYTFIDMQASTLFLSTRISYPESRFPAQVVYLRDFWCADRDKNIRLVSNYNYETKTYSHIVPDTDLSDAVIAVDESDYQTNVPPGLSLSPVFQNIRHCLDFTWQATADIVACWGTDGYHGSAAVFQKGVTYHGIPYRSSWNTASSVGWHVSKQTFMNAANDPDSIFYHSSRSSPGPYYSLVCSSFGTLVSGFPYPMTNFGMMKDPQTQITKTDVPTIGSLMTNGYGHCFIPLAFSYGNDGSSVLTLAEEIGPITAMQNVYEGISKDWKGIGLYSTYPAQYVYRVTPRVFSEPPYDITSYTIKNGSARPYRGDQSVYTSAMDVLINIKDSNANRLYFQEFDIICDHGLPIRTTPVGKAHFITMKPGTKRVNLRSATTENNSFTGAALKNGGIYGVWASDGEKQTTAPDNVEFFEWYNLAEETISYSVKDGALVTDDVFWYARAAGINEQDYIKASRKSGGLTIPYQAPIEKDGEVSAHSDYSNYAARAQILSPSLVSSFFRKGQFGAYITAKQIVDQ